KEKLAILVCGYVNKKEKNKKRIEELNKKIILQKKNKNIIKMLKYPFFIPSSYEIIGLSEIPFVCTDSNKIFIKQFSIIGNYVTSMFRKQIPMFILFMSVYMGVQNLRSSFDVGPMGDHDNVMSVNDLPVNDVPVNDLPVNDLSVNHLSVSEDDKKLLYVYIDKVLNLSNKKLKNIYLWIRFHKNEKYKYDISNIETEKLINILLFSKKKITDINDVLIEVWTKNMSNENKKKEDFCLGIVRINVQEVYNKKNVPYVYNSYYLSHKFNIDINLMFQVILFKEKLDAYENVMHYCHKLATYYNLESSQNMEITNTSFSGIYNLTADNDKILKSEKDKLGSSISFLLEDGIDSYKKYRKNSTSGVRHNISNGNNTTGINRMNVDNEFIYAICKEVLRCQIDSGNIISNVLKKIKRERNKNLLNKNFLNKNFLNKNFLNKNVFKKKRSGLYVKNGYNSGSSSSNNNISDFELKSSSTHMFEPIMSHDKKHCNSYYYSGSECLNINERVSNNRRDHECTYELNDKYINVELIKDELLMTGMVKNIVNLMILELKKKSIKKNKNH
ncbi:conserved protein, unknown function, partial [Hepatocystis sp. ex Piliocolobus tephrosceles]